MSGKIGQATGAVLFRGDDPTEPPAAAGGRPGVYRSAGGMSAGLTEKESTDA